MIEKPALPLSRTPDTLVLRLKDDLHAALTVQARQNWRSIDSEIVFGLQSWLAGPTRMLLRKRILSDHLGAARTREALESVEHLDFCRAAGTIPLAVRLPEGMRERLAGLSAELGLSENRLLLNALCWWVNISRDLRCLLEQAEAPTPNPAGGLRGLPRTAAQD